MATYIARRLIQGVIVLLFVSLFCFVIFRYTGDPAVMLAGVYATEHDRAEIRKAYALDKPFYIQYALFIARAARGDFGNSYVTHIPALKLIMERAPATVEMVTTSAVVALILGIGLGVMVSLKPGSAVSRLIMAASLGGISIPTFLIGILLIMIFSVYLGILPPFGRGETVTIGFWKTGLLTWSGITHLILPALTLMGYQLAVLLRLTRAGMREILTEEYIKTAWAKGLSARRVIFKHALKNALIPVITISGLMLGELLAFSVVTETIFQWPGMGNLLLQSIYNSDQPVIVTYIMLASVIILSINIIVDILYAFLNPRIRYD
jgi:ABC-type dipeptide/oligopeptide/nickel transport system permease component